MDATNFWTLRPLGYAQVAAGGADSAIALPSLPTGAGVAVIKPATQAIRLRDDGTNPTAAVGYPIAVGTEYIYASTSLAAVRIIAQVAGAAVDILYYG
jgi:hypothetical protein